MRIQLDGKNNIFDQAYKDLPENNSTDQTSEKEMKRLVKEINDKVTYDYYNKPVFRIKRLGNEFENDLMDDPLEKARGPVKYIKKITIGGKTRYFYNEQEWKDYKSEKKPEDKEGWISKLSNLFGFQSRSQAMKKIQSDYKTHEIDKKYNMTWDDWKSHVSEYFNRKDKWDAFFSGKKEDKKESSEKKTSEKKEKQVKKETKKSLIKLSVMKLIYDLYGNVSQPAQEVKESNFDTMPEVESGPGKPTEEEKEEEKKETPEQKAIDKQAEEAIQEATPENRAESEAKVFDEQKEPWAMTFEQYKATLFNFRMQYVIDGLKKRIESRESMLSKLKEGDMGYNITVRNLNLDKEYLQKYINGEVDEKFKDNPSWDYLQKEYDKIKDKNSTEAKSLKRKLTIRENKAKAEHERLIINAIKDNKSVPANVIKEYPSIQNNEAKTMSVPDINYKPSQYEKEIYLGGEPGVNNKRKVKINDYTKVPPKDVYLVNEDTILNVPRPSYIPEMDLKSFSGPRNQTQSFDVVRTGPNRYIIVDKRYPVIKRGNERIEFDERSMYDIYESKPVSEEQRQEYNRVVLENRVYHEMSAETLAATWDYYTKLMRAKEIQENEERQDREEALYNRRKQKALTEGRSWNYPPFKRKGVRPTPPKSPDSMSMNYSQAFMIQDFTGIKATVQEFSGPTVINMQLFHNYQSMLKELNFKINDLRMQKAYLDENNTFKKGEETSYGDAGVKNNLLESQGILVKRQNGTEIDDQDITKISFLIEDIYSIFGDRKEMSKKYGLKISYAGEKKMHASKAIGLFVDKYKCIAISDTGIEGRGFTFAHEFSHFMDAYLGNQKGYYFSSDQEGTISNNIAVEFRKKINLRIKEGRGNIAGKDYYNRTCECFARAMEQYYAIKQNTQQELYDGDKVGAYVEHNKFVEKIMPLCEQFLKENDSLLKAFFRHFKDGKSIYRRIK